MPAESSHCERSLHNIAGARRPKRGRESKENGVLSGWLPSPREVIDSARNAASHFLASSRFASVSHVISTASIEVIWNHASCRRQMRTYTYAAERPGEGEATTYTVVTPARDASVAPAAPAGTHQVRSPTMPSAATPRSD
jgi:hypothetical protein